MYLNHPLVPGFPITLRYGEERDRVFLARFSRKCGRESRKASNPRFWPAVTAA